MTSYRTSVQAGIYFRGGFPYLPGRRRIRLQSGAQRMSLRASLLTSRIKKRQAGSESTVVRYLTVFIADTVAPDRV